MDQNVLIGIVIVIALLVVAGLWLSMRRRRTETLREKFGQDEYDRTLEGAGDRSAAEAALAEREKRVEALEIRRLSADEQARFAGEWREVKAVFVDSPIEAVLHADRMLATMMKTVGYPMADFDRRFEDLTVNHGDVARHYRAAHEIAARHNTGTPASTEDLRQAMKHYEALYDHLGTGAEAAAPAASTARSVGGTDMDGDGHRDTLRPGDDGHVTTSGTDMDRDGHPDTLRPGDDGHVTTTGTDLDRDGHPDTLRPNDDGSVLRQDDDRYRL
ncbi:hypothetical protein [Aurantiacibacter luteus]|uniref:hypothetical protein n=1 Tax=Aurantiacibacter luteus TaxID=1581420 RepID=UPI00069B5380|nr:hypothetical protein [Aurantiacibacter luteus]